jgi:sirohydrochlorin ferrochelatase
LKTGIVLFAHGSRVESANDAVRAVAADLARAGGFAHVQAAFLELGRPSLEDAVGRLVEDGVTRVVVVPYFLTLGLHMERDLPRLVDDIASKHSKLEMSVTPPLDGHPALVDVLLDRVRHA